MQKSFLPKETLELKRVGKQHIYPLKRAIVQDASLLNTTRSQNQITTNAHVSAYSHSTFILRNQEVNALEREIEARSGIRYVPGENLVAKELVFPLQSPSRIDCIEREYFPQKHAFLQERHDKVQQPRPQSRASFSEFNPFPLLSETLDDNHIEFHAKLTSSKEHKSLHSVIQHWPSNSNDLASKPKLLLELERSLQSGLQLPPNNSSELNLNLLALHSDILDRYIQHTGTYRGLLAGVKDVYDRAISFMYVFQSYSVDCYVHLTVTCSQDEEG